MKSMSWQEEENRYRTGYAVRFRRRSVRVAVWSTGMTEREIVASMVTSSPPGEVAAQLSASAVDAAHRQSDIEARAIAPPWRPVSGLVPGAT
jgi:hypothetical protein